MKTLLFVVASCLAVCIVCYWPISEGKFAFDDNFAILRNQDLTDDFFNVTRVFSHDFWGQNISADGSHKSFRPITTASFRLSRAICDQLLPDHMTSAEPDESVRLADGDFIKKNDESDGKFQGCAPLMHVENMMLHSLVAFLVYLFTKQMLALPGSPSNSRDNLFSLSVALMFACHPVNSEAVLSIVGRSDLLCAVFSLAGILVQIGHCNFLAFVFFSLGVLSKEVAVIAPLLAVVCVALQNIGGARKSRVRLVHLKRAIGTAACLLVSYGILRKCLMGNIAQVGQAVFRKTENPMAFEACSVNS